MITILKTGAYKLIETKNNIKILYLDSNAFAWVEPTHVGEILVMSHNVHRSDCVLSIGHYHIYNVDDEPHLSDQRHLELEVGKNAWQGYLLPTGLPDDKKHRRRIIPTHEIITGNQRYQYNKELHTHVRGK